MVRLASGEANHAARRPAGLGLRLAPGLAGARLVLAPERMAAGTAERAWEAAVTPNDDLHRSATDCTRRGH
jgi:hypothetical protein